LAIVRGISIAVATVKKQGVVNVNGCASNGGGGGGPRTAAAVGEASKRPASASPNESIAHLNLPAGFKKVVEITLSRRTITQSYQFSLGEAETGEQLVSEVVPGGLAAGKLKTGDIIIAIDGMTHLHHAGIIDKLYNSRTVVIKVERRSTVKEESEAAASLASPALTSTVGSGGAATQGKLAMASPPSRDGYNTAAAFASAGAHGRHVDGVGGTMVSPVTSPPATPDYWSPTPALAAAPRTTRWPPSNEEQDPTTPMSSPSAPTDRHHNSIPRSPTPAPAPATAHVHVHEDAQQESHYRKGTTLYPHTPSDPNRLPLQLSAEAGEVLTVVAEEGLWAIARNRDGVEGHFPLNYISFFAT
jgi:hypothetical protein